MRTLGTFFKETRQSLKLTIAEVEKKTRIKTSFIKAIESESWDDLPEFPVVHGFVRNIAESLSLDPKQALALLRRDYPPKKLPINPKPDIKEKFVWNPRLTFLSGILVVMLFLGTYLGYQYIQFIRPPELTVTNPQEGEVIEQRSIVVTGSTVPEAVVRVNNQPVLLDEFGNFRTEIEIFEGTGEIEIKSISRSGKETVVHRKIEPKLNGD